MNQSELKKLIRKMDRGDEDALRELRELNRKFARLANRNLKKIEDAGKEYTAAYKRAQNFLGTDTRFSLSPDDLAGQLLELNKFVNLKSHTVRGIKAAENKMFRTLSRHGYKVSKENKEDFLMLLSTEAFKEFVNFDSGRALLEGNQALEEGRTVEELERLYKERYIEGKEPLTDIWEEWTIVE